MQVTKARRGFNFPYAGFKSFAFQAKSFSISSFTETGLVMATDSTLMRIELQNSSEMSISTWLQPHDRLSVVLKSTCFQQVVV